MSFRVLICHLYILCAEMSVDMFCPIPNQIIFLLLSFNHSLHILFLVCFGGIVTGEGTVDSNLE